MRFFSCFIVRLAIATCYLFTLKSGICQAPTIFQPADNKTILLTSLSSKYEKQYKEKIKSLPSENKSDFVELYTHCWENIKDKFESNEIYTSENAQKYLDALVAEIVNSNPSLQNKFFNCYFSKTGIPNASYIGEGVIIFNMGLFNRLENESQVVFVLCHEISHFYLNHIENSISKYVTTINSKEFQKELRNINSTEYKKNELLDKLVKNVSFNFTRHSRDHESEADSLAVLFMKNTHFDIREAISTLTLLDSIDTDTLNIGKCLEKTFNAKEYPFKKKWIAKEEGLLGGHAKLDEDNELADSLKTHPDCKKRIKLLEPAIKQYANATAEKNRLNTATFDEMRKIFPYEIASFAFDSKNYSRSLFYTLELLQKNPSDPYLVVKTGSIFNNLYLAQKEHILGKVTDLPSPSYPENYNLLLQFIQNLYKEDYALIGYHYLQQYSPSMEYYAPFKDVFKASIQINK